MIAPAVAAAGALLAATQASGSASPALGAAAGRVGTDRVGDGGNRGSHGHGSTFASGKPAPANTAAASAAPKNKASRAPGAGGQPARPAKPKATLSCTGTSGLLPQNYGAIVGFLTAHGYTKMAAAGIAGNIYQESKGNPESVGSGGGGLIGFTPLPGGYVTGNPAADLHTQLEAILTYNQQWAQYIPALNAATTPTEAADIYMNDFERPGIPAAYNREAAANAVATACGF